MKLSSAPPTLLSFVAVVAILAAEQARVSVTASRDTIFRPHRISYESLRNDAIFNDDSDAEIKVHFKNALSEVGMISVTGIFSDSDSSKKDTLGWLHRCAMASEETQMLSFHDGTVRHTMAASTIPARNVQTSIKHLAVESDKAEKMAAQIMTLPSQEACNSFSKSSDRFRSKVTEATEMFTKRLASAVGVTTPLLHAENDTDIVFESLEDIVDYGEHLEHFHTYVKTNPYKNHLDSSDRTIQLHTDQGLLLVFTPGRKVSSNSNSIGQTTLTKGLYIELKDGTEVEVEFEDGDDLVFMLGDGVNQFINREQVVDTDGFQLRATPHALKIPSLAPDEARVWYGRMVLPPASAIHPTYNMTFAEVRLRMIEASVSETAASESVDTFGLGCSSNRITRLLSNTTSCAKGFLYCWHKCMKLKDYGKNRPYCAKRGMVLGCGTKMSPGVPGEPWDGTHGPQWKPTCLAKNSSDHCHNRHDCP